MNKEAGKILEAARKKRGHTQAQIADYLAKRLDQTYSQRQYQKLEEGNFPKFKTDIVKVLDTYLGTSLHRILYEQNVPHENDAGGLILQEPNTDLSTYSQAKGSKEEPMERIYLVESVRNLTESSRISAEAEKMRESNMARLIAILEDQANEIRRINSGKSIGEKDGQNQPTQEIFESFSDIKGKTGKLQDKGLKKDK